MGDQARWSDSDYLLALVVDSVAHLNYMYAGVHAKNAPKKPPQPIRRPGDVSKVEGVTATVNIGERTHIIAGSLTITELDAVIERQTSGEV